jgi:uncharacterized protein with von Willebrand factor type A (vWA) domain
MRPTQEQHQEIRELLARTQRFREALDQDGENDLGAVLYDAAGGLQAALDIIGGKLNGQMSGSRCG